MSVDCLRVSKLVTLGYTWVINQLDYIGALYTWVIVNVTVRNSNQSLGHFVKIGRQISLECHIIMIGVLRISGIGHPFLKASQTPGNNF